MELKSLISNEEFVKQVKDIKRFESIPNLITAIEGQDLTVSEALSIFKSFKDKLDESSLAKFNKMLKKNENFMFYASKSLRSQYKYAPLTSVAVESSFSKYKELISDRRTNLTPDNIKKLLFVNYNQFIL